ncbi:hypothetical protein JCM10296v2_001392 [Rhodotorula toruloides]
MSTKRPTTTPEEWSKRLAAVNVSKDDLNLLVANYLFTEGYLSAAENFSREAGLDTTRLGTAGGATYDLESIRNRMEIRRAVLKGEVETALEKVVDLDLEILDIDPSLHFHLLQQHLIELIRGQHIPEALAFAQNELAPLAEEHPKFLKELEKTMALLAFELPTLVPGGVQEGKEGEASASTSAAAPPVVKESKKSKKSKDKDASTVDQLPPMPATISSLLDPSQRLQTARELNAAILAAQGHAAEPKLPQLMTMMNWGEGLLLEKGVDWPKWNLHELMSSKRPAPSLGAAAASSTDAPANGDGDAAMAL